MSLACIFPGQGSQSIGMMSGLYETYSIVQDAFTEASDALGFNLWDLIRSGPEDVLNKTDNTQPAMLTSGVACWRAWQSEGGQLPVSMAGHSLGEYTALVCAGALDFADAVKLVAERGRLMQAAVPEGQGAMAAILGLDDETVRSVCDESADEQVVQAVNFNAPGQVVIAGDAEAVERAIEQAKAAGAKRALKLPVSVPSHCSLMRPAADKLNAYMNDVVFNVPEIPVLHNVTVRSSNKTEDLRQALVEQLYSPVRWVETIQTFSTEGLSHVIELGPGKVLTGLNKRIDKTLATLPVFDSASLQAAIEAVS
ncbi:MAG: [acyl-carrier-protein] S-malonyltransferase [Gammaproteobacteria bacterium]|nr:MAG: [acyl-carrier-protein] S-malonyltransferase [Gammaproteobacteria bacterium]